MGSVRLHALSIDEVRAISRAGDALATRLRTVAAERFPAAATPAAPGLLGKLGPVFRRAPDAPVVRPGVPGGSDVELLLTGRYVPPHRLTACWALLDAWLEDLAWGSTGREVTEAQLNEFDFDLACAEVPPRFSLRNLVGTDLGIALLPCPGVVAGWTPGPQVPAMADAWRRALPRLAEAHREPAAGLLEWLDRFPAWTDEAAAQGRPAPDLIAIHQA